MHNKCIRAKIQVTAVFNILILALTDLSMQQQPLVTVLCLSMNHEAFIKKAFQSLLSQTYPEVEVLYVDNHSADHSFAIGNKLLAAGPFPFQAYQRDRPYSISANLNFLLPLAKGKYITILSADDWWEQNNLEERVRYMEAHPRCGFVHSAGFVYHHATGIAEPEKLMSRRSGKVFTSLLRRNFINSIGVMMRAESLQAVGNFDENSLIEDWDMWLRLSQKYELGFIDQRLVYYGKQPSNISENTRFMQDGYEYLFAKYAAYPQVKAAKDYFKMLDIYQEARNLKRAPALLLLLRHFRFNRDYLSQIFRHLCGSR